MPIPFSDDPPRAKGRTKTLTRGRIPRPQARPWALPESRVTDPQVYYNRRRFLKGAAGVGLTMGALGAIGGGRTAQAQGARWTDPPHRPITDPEIAQTYNNFYEFGSHKGIAEAAQSLPVSPWQVVIDGEVESPQTLDYEDLRRRMPYEERIYRLRCVEAWSAVIPWTGFPLAALVDFARPTAAARYLAMQTFDEEHFAAPGFRQLWYPWPYLEGLTMAEATNELAFIATGMYGLEGLPPQNGAPLRLVVPWKYGFKSVKSLVRLTFTREQPKTFWQEVQGREYGFWANVNPDVPHPRWSQATERPLGLDERIDTQIYNGYGPYVASLYADLDLPDEVLFR
ncbi:MAG: protein-methionine-sulfoxide reductase catalytic subunit MsrP [Pseudomonadota bacterium]